MRNVLVFPCGSEIGLDIYNSVRYSTHFHLIGANSTEDHGSFIYEDYIPGVPYVTDPSFITSIKQIIARYSIDVIYPTMDSVITVLKAHEKELNCKVIGSPCKTSDICLSKSKTYHALCNLIRTPRIYRISEILSFPVFVKPDIGYGGRGACCVYDKDSLTSIIGRNPDYLILEYLPGQEYTVDCFTDKNGALIYAEARVRNRIKAGISVNTSFVDDQSEFRAIAEKINAALTFRGAWFIQLKRDGMGQLCLLEIASRMGGSSLLSLAKGVNLALMSLFDAFDFNIRTQINEGYDVTLDRALGASYRLDGLSYSTIYVDYDDCLVLNKTDVNIELIRFLFHCLNQGKRIILLTKHLGDLYTELHRFRLDGLFDQIIHINTCEKKTDFIQYKDAIYIDDSFSEREEIKETYGIPVFGPEMINILL